MSGSDASTVQEQKEVKPEGKKRGRPKDPNKKKMENATFMVDPELLRKMKYISLVDDKMLKDILDEALTAYVAQWETENGRIRLPHKKN